MKIPKIFVLEKSLEKNVETLLNPKNLVTKPIDNILSLTCISEEVGAYALRTDFEIISKKNYEMHFGKRIPRYIIRAGQMTYQIPFSLFFTSIYALEFKNGTDLNKLNKKINLKKEISQIDVMRTKCLGKDNYLIAIKANHVDKYSLDVFESWYLNNFGLEEL